MKLTSEIWQSVNHIPGIHDNGPRDHGLWRLTLTAYIRCIYGVKLWNNWININNARLIDICLQCSSKNRRDDDLGKQRK